MDPLEKAIRHHLDRYLAGTQTLDELQDWLVNATWNVEKTASPAAAQLAYDVELVLAERSSGFLTAAELRADLLEIAGRSFENSETALSA